MVEKILLTPHDVAKILGISRGKCYELFRRPDFPVLKLGKLMKVTREALEQWLSRQMKIQEAAL